MGLLGILARPGCSRRAVVPRLERAGAGAGGGAGRALFSGDPLLAHWTQTFMVAAAGFVAQFFPLFLVGAIFGKLMDDSGSVADDRALHDRKAGHRARDPGGRAGRGASSPTAASVCSSRFFVIVPMAQGLFRTANIPEPADAGGRRAGHHDLHDVGDAGHACRPECHPDALLRHDAVRRAGTRHHRFGDHARLSASGGWPAPRRRRGRPARAYGEATVAGRVGGRGPVVRERATTVPVPSILPKSSAATQQPGTAGRPGRRTAAGRGDLGQSADVDGGDCRASIPASLPNRSGAAYRSSSVSGVWSVIVALIVAILVLVALNRSRLTGTCAQRSTPAPMPRCCPSSASPAWSASARSSRRCRPSRRSASWVLSIEGGPLVSLAVSTNVLAALTGSASGGMTIALEALGPIYLQIAERAGHRSGAAASRRGDRLPAPSTACRTTARSSPCWPFADRRTARAISTS